MVPPEKRTVDGYAVFSVTAEGKGLSYQWQYSTNRGTSWYSSSSAIQGYNTDTLTIQATDARSGFLYRCKITDVNGNVVYSDRAQIDLGDTYALAILTQPHTFTGVYGDTAVFTTSADGEGLTYQWQFKNSSSGAWWDSTMAGSNTSSISVQFTPAREAYLYRCKVTDGAGNIRYTEGAGFFLDEHTWQYTYQTEGLRTGRTDGKTTYSYIYNGSQLTQMTVGSNTLTFAYDANGKPLTVTLNGAVYYYTTNLQGDVTGIWDASGNQVASYTYDAWGNVTVESDDPIADYNPLTYRGYVYDAETGFYYLQSRYYDPQVGRFINADNYAATGQDFAGNNMFVYCGNNPVIRADSVGLFWEIVAAMVVSAAVNVVTTYIAAKATGLDYSWVDAGIAAVSGAANVVHPLASGVITGVYTGCMAAKNGASTGGAVLSGIVAGVCTTSSIGNLANSVGKPLSLGVNATVDLVFGTGYNCIAAATYQAVTPDEAILNTAVQDYSSSISSPATTTPMAATNNILISTFPNMSTGNAKIFDYSEYLRELLP